VELFFVFLGTGISVDSSSPNATPSVRHHSISRFASESSGEFGRILKGSQDPETTNVHVFITHELAEASPEFLGRMNVAQLGDEGRQRGLFAPHGRVRDEEELIVGQARKAWQ